MLREAFPGEMRREIFNPGKGLITDQSSHLNGVSLATEEVYWGHLNERGQLRGSCIAESLPCQG